MVRSQKSIGAAVGATLGNAPYGDCVLLPSAFHIALKPTVSINVHGAFPKIDRWSSRNHFGERTLRLSGATMSYVFCCLSRNLVIASDIGCSQIKSPNSCLKSDQDSDNNPLRLQYGWNHIYCIAYPAGLSVHSRYRKQVAPIHGILKSPVKGLASG